MLINIRNCKDGKEINPIWFDIYNLYKEDEDWKDKLEKSIKGLNYKEFYENRKVKESVRGFSPLQENLEKWMEYTLKEMEH